MKKISRAHFLGTLLGGTLVFPGRVVLGAGTSKLRGDRVGWARLKTSSPHWRRHAGSDPVLMNFFRDETTLNIDPTWYSADVNHLDELCQYPFLFSQGVGVVREPAARGNLAEYIRRGGFLLVDACCNPAATPNYDVFLKEHEDFFPAVMPESKMALLPSSHEIYRCHFQIPNGHPPHTFMQGVYDAHKAQFGLYGVMLGERLAGLVSLCGLQCGWDHITINASVAPPGHDQACMKMLVNIYIEAMMQRR